MLSHACDGDLDGVPWWRHHRNADLENAILVSCLDVLHGGFGRQGDGPLECAVPKLRVVQRLLSLLLLPTVPPAKPPRLRCRGYSVSNQIGEREGKKVPTSRDCRTKTTYETKGHWSCSDQSHDRCTRPAGGAGWERSILCTDAGPEVGDPMKVCRKCHLPARLPLTVQLDQGPKYTFDCFDCAIETLAPRCPECGRVYLGRPVTYAKQQFCSTACAQRRQARDAWSPAPGEGCIDGIGSTPPRIGVRLIGTGAPRHEGFTNAHIGDTLIVRSHAVDRPPRRATIMELRGPNGAPPYVVRWHDDDHVSLCFPGSDATLERHSTPSAASA